MIRAVFFDVGGTLIYPHPSVGAIYAATAERHGVEAAPDILNQRFASLWKQGRRSTPMNRTGWRTVVDAVFEGFSFRDADAFFADVYAAFSDPQAWRLYPDVLPTLEELRKRERRLAIVSNWDERLPALLEKLKLTPFFEEQFISCAMGVAKPDPAIFERALEFLSLSPLETVHVGDDPVEDIAAAEKAGIRAYLINRRVKPLNARSMSDLSEILLRV